MNIRQLTAFRAIMTTGSVTAAAAAMNLTQSAVSRLLGQLEEELGLSLFIRDKGRLIAVPEAVAILEEVDKVTGSISRLKRLASEFAAGVESPEIIRIAGPISASETILPICLESFLASRPNVVVETLIGTASEVERWVHNGQVDLGIARLRNLGQSNLSVSEILRSEMVCVMSDTHPLRHNDHIRPRDLSDVPLVLLGRYTATRAHMEKLFRKDGIRQMRVRVETHTVGSACALAARKVGVAIVSGLFAQFYGHMKIVVRPFKPRLSHRFVFITLEGKTLSIASRALMEEVRAGFLAAREGPAE